MKRFLKVLPLLGLLAALLLAPGMAVRAESYKAGGECGPDLKWSLDYSGNLVIYGEGTMTNYGFWDYNTRGWGDFKDEIKTVTVEKGATTIGRSAFEGCVNLKKVKLPSTVTVLESDSFRGCTSLSTINLPVGLEKLGGYVFENCTSLQKISFPKTLTNLGGYGSGMCCFKNTGLKSVSIPSSVSEMGGYCFQECKQLTSVTISGTNLTIPFQAFMDCVKLKTVKMGRGVVSTDRDCFENCTSLTSLTLSEDLTVIGGACFKGCTSLRSVVIPDKVTIMKDDEWSRGTFQDCTALRKVVVGAAMTEIQQKCFMGCKSLKEIYFAGAAPAFGGNETFSGCGTMTAYYPKNSKTWDRSVLTAHGAARVNWKTWTPPLDHFTPELLSVTNIDGGVQVKWRKLSGATGYQICRKTGNGSYTTVQTIKNGTKVKWNDTSVANGKRYTYRIYALNGKGKSKVSDAIPTYYLAKNTISLSKKARNVTVKWKKNTSSTGYLIQYSKSAKFGSSTSVTVNKRSKSGKVIAVSLTGKVYFRVAAYKTVNGETYYSAWSAAKSLKL